MSPKSAVLHFTLESTHNKKNALKRLAELRVALGHFRLIRVIRLIRSKPLPRSQPTSRASPSVGHSI